MNIQTKFPGSAVQTGILPDEIERRAFELMAASQPPHPMFPPFTAETLMARGREEALRLLRGRKERIRLAEEDHFHHGWFFDSWDDLLWEMARLRVAQPGIPVEFLVAGSNGAAKSHFVARLYTLAMEQCEPEWPEHQRTFWTFSYDDDKSAEVVESVIRFWQPNEYKTETGRLKKLAGQKMGYDAAGGFTNNELAVSSGAVCRFRTWAQFLGKLEGPRPVCCWSDEAVPAAVLDAIVDRLLTAAEETLKWIPKWEELLAAKAENAALRFPLDLVGRLLVGMSLVTYTFRDGMTDTVRRFLGKAGDRDAVVMREIEADPELLPRRDETGAITGGEKLPCLVHGAVPTRRAMWIYAWQNPLGGNWAGMKKAELGSPRAKILWKCYGVAEGTADSPFPNFNMQVHVRPVPSALWLPPYDKGTWWMSGDPNASGGRAWCLLWAFVVGETWHHLAPGDIVIAHEYPQTNDTVIVPGHELYTGEACEWALPGGKNGLGVRGLAQKQWPVGYAFRASEIRRVEAKLAAWQGLTEMRGHAERTMLDLEGRRILDSRSGNTATENQDGGKTIIEWMEENELYFMRAGNDAGGEGGSGRVIPGEQNINSQLMWNRELAEIDPVTGWREVNPQHGRGPKVRIAAHCTNLIGALQNYPGIGVEGASKSPWKDFIDALRYLLNANPEHVTGNGMPQVVRPVRR